MPNGVPITPEQMQKIARLWREGISTAALATRFRMSHAGMRTLIARLRKQGKLYEEGPITLKEENE